MENYLSNKRWALFLTCRHWQMIRIGGECGTCTEIRVIAHTRCSRRWTTKPSLREITTQQMPAELKGLLSFLYLLHDSFERCTEVAMQLSNCNYYYLLHSIWISNSLHFSEYYVHLMDRENRHMRDTVLHVQTALDPAAHLTRLLPSPLILILCLPNFLALFDLP